MGKQWKQLQTLFSWAQNHCGQWLQHEIKRCLLLERKAMTNPDSILKRRDTTFPTKVHIVKGRLFLNAARPGSGYERACVCVCVCVCVNSGRKKLCHSALHKCHRGCQDGDKNTGSTSPMSLSHAEPEVCVCIITALQIDAFRCVSLIPAISTRHFNGLIS